VIPALLAWRPFLDPLPLDGPVTWLYLPLILLIALVLRALREIQPRRILREALGFALQVTVYLLVACGLVWIIAAWG